MGINYRVIILTFLVSCGNYEVNSSKNYIDCWKIRKNKNNQEGIWRYNVNESKCGVD
jgi:hypothetical protein